MPDKDLIDWKEVRRRILLTPVAVPPVPSRESLERKRAKDRARWNRFYHEHPGHCHGRQKAWEEANPDKVKAKRDRCYAKLKLDPARLERKRERQRQYRARRKLREAA